MAAPPRSRVGATPRGGQAESQAWLDGVLVGALVRPVAGRTIENARGPAKLIGPPNKSGHQHNDLPDPFSCKVQRRAYAAVTLLTGPRVRLQVSTRHLRCQSRRSITEIAASTSAAGSTPNSCENRQGFLTLLNDSPVPGDKVNTAIHLSVAWQGIRSRCR